MTSTPLNPPPAKRQEFENNHLDTVIVELRYPTYLSLETESPTELSKQWRSRFPIYTIAYNTNINPTGTSSTTPSHQFSDRRKRWTISLTPHNISLSTKDYKNFEELLDLVLFVSDTALPYLETDFFTRIGLRYVNKIHVENSSESLKRAVNSELASLSISGVLGSVRNLRTEVQGKIENRGEYVFKYGIANDSQASTSKISKNAIILDFDYMDEDVSNSELKDLLQSFHDVHFRFFWWTLGEDTKTNLIPSKTKN